MEQEKVHTAWSFLVAFYVFWVYLFSIILFIVFLNLFGGLGIFASVFCMYFMIKNSENAVNLLIYLGEKILSM